MILVDTNIWIDHLRNSDPRLVRLLEDDLVVMHPWVLGELSLGSLANRDELIQYLGYLTSLGAESDDRISVYIQDKRLWGRGIGWVDAGLLASCIARNCQLWTKDRALGGIAAELGVALEA